jgi:hypothetical protein
MPDLLEVQPTPKPDMFPQVDMTTTEGLLREILKALNKTHPNQRAIVKLESGATTFPNDVSTRVEFFGHGNTKVKSHKTMISHPTDITLYISVDAPVTFNGAGAAINAFGPIPIGVPLYINEEISHLYLYVHAAAPATYTVNNSDNGSATPIVHIESWTNPEEVPNDNPRRLY